MAFKWNWGWGIATTYVAFAAGTLGMVVFAMEQPIELVRPDYYEQSLRENQRMAATANADALGESLACAVSGDGRTLLVKIPAADHAAVTGTITLYRPSSSGADRSYPLVVDAGGQQILSLDGLARGHWKVNLDWTSGDRSFYREQPILVP